MPTNLTAADINRELCVIASLFHADDGSLGPAMSKILDLAPRGFRNAGYGEIAVAIRTVRNEGNLPVNAATVGEHVHGNRLIDLATIIGDSNTLPPEMAEDEAEKLLAEIQRNEAINLLGAAWEEAKDDPDRAAEIAARTSASIQSLQIHELDRPKEMSFTDGIRYNTGNDPNALIGLRNGYTTRFLNRGQGKWVIAPSGIGKSVLLVQMACRFALGQPLFGIQPIRKLRALILQAENDEGDVAEMIQGCAKSLDGILDEHGQPDEFSDALENLNNNVKIMTERTRIGEQFCRWLGREIERFRADVVYIDPLLSFAGIDVSRQDQCSKFLRQWLNPMLASSGCAMIGSHHTGKPKSQKDTKGWTAIDFAYSGLGSSELVNWARALSIIVPRGEGLYQLQLLKRGQRAGATHPDGTETTSVWLRHGDGRLWWQQVPPPVEDEPEAKGERKGGRKSEVEEIAAMNLASFCSACLPEGEGINAISRRLERWLNNEHGIDKSESTCERTVKRLVKTRKIAKGDDGLYRKGPNA